jgi:hypothetical protein
MSLLMYAISDAPPASIEGVGLGGHPLRAIADGGLSAVVGDYEVTRGRSSEDELWAYEGVVERLMADTTVLPARFGSLFQSELEARAMLRDRGGALAAALDRVRDSVELAVRAGWSADDEASAIGPGETSGTQYMRAQLERRRRARQAADALGSLEGLARESRIRERPDASASVVGAYLVDRSRVEEFVALVEDLGDAEENLSLVCTGPWPPYSFVDGEQR